MSNPWLDIPLDDYERHMALSTVGQAQLLADLFSDTLRAQAPASVAIVGCAGGNGFERIDTRVTRRVVGIDLNPAYLAAAQARFAGRLPNLDLLQADVTAGPLACAPVEFAFAGLLFEHVDVPAALRTIHALIVPGGLLVCVIQLASAAAVVSPSPYSSLHALAPHIRLLAPERLTELALAAGFVACGSRRVRSRGGKDFQVQSFRSGGG